MTVNSLAFFLCFGVSVVIYYLFPKKYRWTVLLTVSLIFYHWMGVDNFLYVLFTTATLVLSTQKMYQIEQKLEKELKEQKETLSRQEKKEKKAKAKAQKRRWLVLGVLVTNLGVLLVLKYGNFFINNVNLIFQSLGLNPLNKLGLLAPLGISYYTLQSIGYALEVYKGKSVPEKNPLKVLLFVTYYPQMTQGPIGRYPDLAPQLYEGHEFSYHNLSFGCQRILWGLFKKMVIADHMRPMVNTIFDHYATQSGFTLFLGCIYMTVQVYADFSGYTDIVLGVSQVYGIEMMENFQRPFSSQSLSEYWRRWHISLSSWFRDYVFYPASISKGAMSFGKLGKKICSPRIRKLFPVVYALSLVWFCTGFWHDASWRYIFWGIANGVVIISAIILEPQFQWMKEKLHIPQESRWWKNFCVVRTFLIIALLKVFPGPNDTHATLVTIKRILFHFQPSLTREAFFPGMETYALVYIAFGLLVFFLVSRIQAKGSAREYLEKKPFVVRWAIYLILMAAILGLGVFDNTMVGGFEYAQF